jgi:ABC-2 type transport system ATP-binding protein
VVHAIDGVSLQVYDSEVLSVVGESGSGKTTLVRILATELEPTSGSAKINGLDVSKIIVAKCK